MNHSTQAIATPNLVREGLRNLCEGAQHLRTSKARLPSAQILPHSSPFLGAPLRGQGLED